MKKKSHRNETFSSQSVWRWVWYQYRCIFKNKQIIWIARQRETNKRISILSFSLAYLTVFVNENKRSFRSTKICSFLRCNIFRPLFSLPSLPVQLLELFCRTNQLTLKPKLCVKIPPWMLTISNTYIKHQTELLPKNKDNWNKSARRPVLPHRANTGDYSLQMLDQYEKMIEKLMHEWSFFVAIQHLMDSKFAWHTLPTKMVWLASAFENTSTFLLNNFNWKEYSN